jgi:chromosome segregation ATPase
MASELQAKLNEKQSKCQEIEAQFKALKNSVAKNAVFSRTGKKLKESTIETWEIHEGLKDSEVHQYRLQNISLRNRHENLDKIYKKKEQLADGLHLIDFEQLKIENQTLNEKIEERNEELHKLRKKITDTVVKLSHTREKYQYICKQNEFKNHELVALTD